MPEEGRVVGTAFLGLLTAVERTAPLKPAAVGVILIRTTYFPQLLYFHDFKIDFLLSC